MTRTEVPSEEVGYAELKGIAEKVRLYRVPRADEPTGTLLKQRGNLLVQEAADGGSAATRALPFNGYGLDQVRDRLGAGPVQALAPAFDHVQDLVAKTPEQLRNIGNNAGRAFHWWQGEVRHSRAVQYITMAVIALLIALLIWGVHKPKPKTPWQKIQRTFGL